MILKNFQVRVALSLVDRLLATPLPFRAKLAVSRNKKALAEVAEIFETSSNEIMNECAKKDEEGNFVHPTDEHGNTITSKITIQEDRIEEFNKRIVALNNEETDIDIAQVEVNDDVEAALSSLVDFDPTPILWLFKE